MVELTTEFGPEIEPYYKLIGKLAITWAEFELSVNEAIWELANVTREAGTCMTSQFIGPGPRFRCLVSLLNLRKAPDALVKAINVLSGEAENLGRQRNRYLHDPLMRDRDTGRIYRMETTADRTLKHIGIPVETEEIGRLVEKIETIDADFDDIYLRVLAETPLWPRTQFEQSPGIRRHRSARESSPSVRESI